LPPEEMPVQRAARGEEVRGLEEEVRFDDGTSLFLLGNATPLRNADGEVTGAVAAFVDITQRKRMEMALQESERRFRMIADNITVFAWTADELGVGTWVQQAVVRLHRVDGRGIIGVGMGAVSADGTFATRESESGASDEMRRAVGRYVSDSRSRWSALLVFVARGADSRRSRENYPLVRDECRYHRSARGRAIYSAIGGDC
jgi:PAS domain S-box